MGKADDQELDEAGGQPQDLPDAAETVEGVDESAIWDEIDESEQAAAGDDSLGDEPGEETTGAVSDDPPERQPAKDVKPPAPRADADPFANATEEQRAAWQAAQKQIKGLEEKDRSQRNRVAALQRKYEAPASIKPPAAAKDGKKTEDTTDILASDEWKSFETEYPEVAGPVGKTLNRLLSTVARQDKELAAIGDDRRQSALLEQEHILEQDHPDWRDVTEADEFIPWLENQPRYVIEAAMRNANEIVDAIEAADLVGRFKAFRSADGGGQSLTPDTSRPAKGQGNGTTRLSGKRQRQLESAAGARSRTPGPATGIPADGDPEVLWKQFDEQERRQGQQA